MALEKQIKRKFLPLLGNLGSFGALAFSIYYALYPETVIYWILFSFVMMLIGTLAGIMIVDHYEKKGKEIVRADQDRVRIILQPAYLYALIPFTILYIIGSILNSGFMATFFAFALVPTVFFILGIGNGIFDFTQVAKRKMLYIAIIPITISLFIAFVASPYGFYQDPIWLFGSLYLLFFMLIINRIKIEETFIFSRRVNVENKRSIRRRNDFLILIFFALYLIIFVIRNTFSKVSDWLIMSMFAVFNWIINQFYKLYTEIDVEYITDVAGQEEDVGLPPINPPMNPILKTILIVMASLVIAIVLYFTVKKIIQLIRWIGAKVNDTMSGERTLKKDLINEEFEEIIEVTSKSKDRTLLKRAPRFKYTLRELKSLNSYKEKVRYLYGFALERLKYKNINISKADTPEQIVNKLLEQENGNVLVEKVFKEFTKEYIDVRYGDKVDKVEHSIDDKANLVEDGINRIKPKETDEKI